MSAILVVGIRASELLTVKTTPETVTRYKYITGEPHKIVIEHKRRYFEGVELKAGNNLHDIAERLACSIYHDNGYDEIIGILVSEASYDVEVVKELDEKLARMQAIFPESNVQMFLIDERE